MSRQQAVLHQGEALILQGKEQLMRLEMSLQNSLDVGTSLSNLPE